MGGRLGRKQMIKRRMVRQKGVGVIPNHLKYNGDEFQRLLSKRDYYEEYFHPEPFTARVEYISDRNGSETPVVKSPDGIDVYLNNYRGDIESLTGQEVSVQMKNVKRARKSRRIYAIGNIV